MPRFQRPHPQYLPNQYPEKALKKDPAEVVCRRQPPQSEPSAPLQETANKSIKKTNLLSVYMISAQSSLCSLISNGKKYTPLSEKNGRSDKI